jgi:putative DNA primase/helicase
MDGVRRVPYRLPDMLAAIAAGEPIFILEGEKCVDIARALGVSATTNSGGAGTWPTEIIHWFAGADVIPSPDGNKVGHTHALKVARALRGVAKRIRIVPLPGVGEKDDIEQWIAAGGTLEQLLELAEQAPDYDPPPAEPEQPVQEREPWSAAAEERVCDAPAQMNTA